MLAVGSWIDNWYTWTSIVACLVTVAGFALHHFAKTSVWLAARVTTPIIKPILNDVDSIKTSVGKLETLIESMHYQLHYNGGHSLRDQVRETHNIAISLDRQVDVLIEDVDQLKTEVAEHRGFHEGLKS